MRIGLLSYKRWYRPRCTWRDMAAHPGLKIMSSTLAEDGGQNNWTTLPAELRRVSRQMETLVWSMSVNGPWKDFLMHGATKSTALRTIKAT